MQVEVVFGGEQVGEAAHSVCAVPQECFGAVSCPTFADDDVSAGRCGVGVAGEGTAGEVAERLHAVIGCPAECFFAAVARGGRADDCVAIGGNAKRSAASFGGAWQRAEANYSGCFRPTKSGDAGWAGTAGADDGFAIG